MIQKVIKFRPRVPLSSPARHRDDNNNKSSNDDVHNDVERLDVSVCVIETDVLLRQTCLYVVSMASTLRTLKSLYFEHARLK